MKRDDMDDRSSGYPFLERLGLDEAADERSIRRAYAQRLKRIDQAADVDGFQQLRDDYETALRWLSWQRHQTSLAASDDVRDAGTVADAAHALADGHAAGRVEGRGESSAGAPPAQAPALRPVDRLIDTPQSLADAAFAVLEARRAQVFSSEAAARQALEDALADDHLVNLEARALFEWRVACTLAQGWQPGHEMLFGPACSLFQWDVERRRLSAFGQVGAALDRAIDERLMFFRQSADQFDRHRQLVQRLRDDTPPDDDQVFHGVPPLRALVQRYPHWLGMITSQANYQRWNERFEAMPAGSRTRAAVPGGGPKAKTEPARGTQQGGFAGWGLGLILVIVMLNMIGQFSDKNRGSPAVGSTPPWQSTSPLTTPAGTVEWRASQPVPTDLLYPTSSANTARSPGLPTAKSGRSADSATGNDPDRGALSRPTAQAPEAAWRDALLDEARRAIPTDEPAPAASSTRTGGLYDLTRTGAHDPARTDSLQWPAVSYDLLKSADGSRLAASAPVGLDRR